MINCAGFYICTLSSFPEVKAYVHTVRTMLFTCFIYYRQNSPIYVGSKALFVRTYALSLLKLLGANMKHGLFNYSPGISVIKRIGDFKIKNNIFRFAFLDKEIQSLPTTHELPKILFISIGSKMTSLLTLKCRNYSLKANCR